MVNITKINDTTYSLEDGFVRFFLLIGEEKAAMIDSGVSGPDGVELAKTITDKPIILINTHGDGDHLAGTGGFKEIHIHPADYEGSKCSERFPDTALAAIADGDVIDLGKRPLRMIHIPGHTAGSMAILDINNRVLIAGDSVQKGHIFMFGGHRRPLEFEASLNKLIALKDEYDTIYASHAECIIPGDYAEKVKSAWLKVLAGEVAYEMVDMHGNKVKSYTTEDCGFFTE